MRQFPEGEIKQRLSLLAEYLASEDIGCALIAQNVDRLYYSGTLQDGLLFVGGTEKPTLFIRRTLSRAREESPLDSITGMKKLEEVCAHIRDLGLERGKIGLEMDILPVRLYRTLTDALPKAFFVDISKAIRRQRAIKSGFEIGLLTESGRRFDRVFERLRDAIHPGLSEYDVYSRFIGFLIEEGSSLTVRTRTFNMEAEQRYIISGKNAAKHSAMDSPSAAGEGVTVAFPGGAGYGGIGPNEPLLVDAVFIHEGYIVDCTRIFSLGSLEARFMHAHAVSTDCHGLFREAAERGDTIQEIYRLVREYVEKQGLGDAFMGGVRFIGHGVGFELDEFPIITENFEGRLQPGMVVAFEPKFVFEDGAVGYENTYVIKPGGSVEALTVFDTAVQIIG